MEATVSSARHRPSGTAIGTLHPLRNTTCGLLHVVADPTLNFVLDSAQKKSLCDVTGFLPLTN
jgi:hypothetical protein